MITATLVRSLNDKHGDGSKKLWRLSQPVEAGWDGKDITTTEFVVSSAAEVLSYGPETYLFPATAEGEVVNWLEMAGSFKGTLDHEEALERAGWVIATPPAQSPPPPETNTSKGTLDHEEALERAGWVIATPPAQSPPPPETNTSQSSSATRP